MRAQERAGDSHRHQITSRQEFHDQVQVIRVLERVVQLDDPRRVGFGEHVSFGTDVCELEPTARGGGISSRTQQETRLRFGGEEGGMLT